MATAAAGDYSKIFKVSFCNTCSDTEVFISGEEPFDVGIEHEVKRGIQFNMPVEMLANAPKVELGEILSTVCEVGVIEGTCSVKVNLATKKIVFIEANKWDGHKCMGGRTIGNIFEALVTKAMASKNGNESTAGSSTILRVVSESSLSLVPKCHMLYGNLSATIIGKGIDIRIGVDGVLQVISVGPSFRITHVDKKA